LPRTTGTTKNSLGNDPFVRRNNFKRPLISLHTPTHLCLGLNLKLNPRRKFNGNLRETLLDHDGGRMRRRRKIGIRARRKGKRVGDEGLDAKKQGVRGWEGRVL